MTEENQLAIPNTRNYYGELHIRRAEKYEMSMEIVMALINGLKFQSTFTKLF